MAEKQDIQSQSGLFVNRSQDLNSSFGQGQMSLASMFSPGNKGGFIDVVNHFTWSLSPRPTKSEAPVIILKEFEVNEGKILSSALRFLRDVGRSVTGQVGGIVNTLTFGLAESLGVGGQFDSLEAYHWLFPKDKPTGFVYQLPFFSEINFNVRSDPWKDIDNLKNIGSGIADTANAITPGAGDWMSKWAGRVTDWGKTGLDVLGGYPITSPTDKPKMWGSHTPRTFEVKFPLFNTFNPDDWKINRDLCVLLVNQNLYNKRDYVTSLPPVFYEVLVPGQHYSYAACVTDITVYNRGNMRTMKTKGTDGDMSAVVPDAYEVNISLTDLTLPSKNLFQQINKSKVYTEIVKTS
jgi:hypothetical protein